MEERQSLIPRMVARLKFLRYRMFGRGPTRAEWEQRLRRIVVPTVTESLRWIPRTGGSFIDVGANCGIYAENILKERPGAQGWLFEPVREHFESCVARVGGAPGIVVENLALADWRGPTTIWKLKHNPGGKIRIAVFDEYAREHGIRSVDFIKTDTDGYDSRVLRGMLGFLEACEPRPVILAELLNEATHPDFAGQLEVLESLYRLGYARVDLTGMDDVQDFLFVPEGRRPVE